MSAGGGRRLLATAVVVVTVVGFAAAKVLEARSGGGGDDPLEGAVLVVAFALLAVLGAVLLVRRPGHILGPLFAAVGVVPAITTPTEIIVAATVIDGRTPSVLARLAVWPITWYWFALVGTLVIYLPLLFPDGRLPSRRWRWLAWPVTAVLTLGCAVSAISEDILLETLGPDGQNLSVANPLGISGVPHGEDSPVFVLMTGTVLIGVVGAVAAVVVRFRRSHGIERQQLKWFLFAVCLLGASALLDLLPGRVAAVVSGMTGFVGAPALPLAIAVAIFRYRLYDIDRLISRTVTYAVVSTVLLAVYAAVVLLPGMVFGLTSDLLVAAATLAAAGLFVPLRRRVQRRVDRRFNRAHYDAARVVERFATRLRDELDLDGLAGDICGVVASTVQPTRVSLWLRRKPARFGSRRPATAGAGSRSVVAT